MSIATFLDEIARGVTAGDGTGTDARESARYINTATRLFHLRERARAARDTRQAIWNRLLPSATPTLTISGPGATTSITNGVDYRPTTLSGGAYSANGLFGYAACVVEAASPSTFPDYHFVKRANYTTASDFTGVCAEFYCTADRLEILMKGQAGRIQIYVNGNPVTADPTQPIAVSDGQLYRYLVDFSGVAQSRHYRVETQGTFFGGVCYDSTQYQLWGDNRYRGPRLVVLGDSHTDGTGAAANYAVSTFQWRSFVRALEDAGFDAHRSGVGGTGYLKTNGSRVNFVTRYATDVAALSPDVVVFAGGSNDTAENQVSLGTQISSLFATHAAALPNALTIVCSNAFLTLSPTTAQTNTKATIYAAVQTARNLEDATFANGSPDSAARYNLWSWVDWQGLMDPANIKRPAGENGWYTSDNGHYSLAGHTRLGNAILSSLATDGVL